MTKRPTSLLAASGLVVALVGGVVADVRAADRHSKVAAAPPLSAAERAQLQAAGPIVLTLQDAINEVPLAASDLSHGQVTLTAAQGRIEATPALVALTTSGPAVRLVMGAYRDVLSGVSLPPEDQLAVAVNQLSALEGDVLPAVRVAAAARRRPPAAPVALEAIERDQKTAALGMLVSNWSQTYGALTLLEQASPQN